MYHTLKIQFQREWALLLKLENIDLYLYHAFVYSYLTSCIEVWGNMSNVHLDALVKI